MKFFNHKLAKAAMVVVALTIVSSGAGTASAALHVEQPQIEANKSLPAGDMFRGADNFYNSNNVDGQKVTFYNIFKSPT
ncbi:hypothetical protein [Pectinatus haikarae]|uniref:Uncharacterized protein n=1 Tax=Pectinatus haikarae TaxID=349096 RepID=A0ABT9YCF6_9FIRM|nr:hypothetical protein [Pectinatus haikarae]MDQ0205201.1 hypothetical protein [Pectinatus haikarae]